MGPGWQKPQNPDGLSRADTEEHPPDPGDPKEPPSNSHFDYYTYMELHVSTDKPYGFKIHLILSLKSPVFIY